MGQKLPAKQLELYKRIDEVLWQDWDPIGVSDCEGARDEYHSYLPKVFRMAYSAGDRKVLVPGGDQVDGNGRRPATLSECCEAGFERKRGNLAAS